MEENLHGENAVKNSHLCCSLVNQRKLTNCIVIYQQFQNILDTLFFFSKPSNIDSVAAFTIPCIFE